MGGGGGERAREKWWESLTLFYEERERASERARERASERAREREREKWWGSLTLPLHILIVAKQTFRALCLS